MGHLRSITQQQKGRNIKTPRKPKSARTIRRAHTMTPELARNIGRDAGNKNMRKAGRTGWNEVDYNIATEALLQAMALVPKEK